jgi:hypothetical protein
MAEEAIKKRMKRAIKAAINILSYPEGNYDAIFTLGNGEFHLEAIRQHEIRKIKIVLDEIKKEDEAAISAITLPSNCTKEIWCRDISGSFQIKKIPAN